MHYLCRPLVKTSAYFFSIDGRIAQLPVYRQVEIEFVKIKRLLCRMIHVYVLKSLNNWRFYVGMTANVEKRLKEHNSGFTKSTKGYLPWDLFFFESYPSRFEARKREKYLKSGVGKEFIKEKWSHSSAG